jgi:predicted nucleotide-binding protein
MSETNAFLKNIAPLGLTSVERAIALLWWHSRDDHSRARSAADLSKEIELAGYPGQNASRLREGLEKDRRAIRSAGGKFRVRVDARAVLDKRYLSSAPVLAPVGESVPVAAVARSTRGAMGPAASAPEVGQRAPHLPRVFVGSSVEGLAVAEVLQEGLEHDAEVTVWSQGVFGLSGATLETLGEIAGSFDFAILVLSPDDLLEKRGSRRPTARDNVLFELGLFVGALGRRRTFIVHPRGVDMHMPSDLAGVTTATYAPDRSDGRFAAALGPVCTKAKREFKEQGNRAR